MRNVYAGQAHLVGVVGHSPRLSWRESITLEADFCMEAVEDALARHGQPDTFITDQGNEFTCTDFIKVLAGREIKISLEGKGAWRDNLFVERLCRAIKYEEVCPCPCTASVIVPDPNAAMWATLQARMSGA
jgi:hypothetical protein